MAIVALLGLGYYYGLWWNCYHSLDWLGLSTMLRSVDPPNRIRELVYNASRTAVYVFECQRGLRFQCICTTDTIHPVVGSSKIVVKYLPANGL